MDHMAVKEAGVNWDASSRMAAYYCVAGTVMGAAKNDKLRLMPKDARKPTDGRRKKT